MAANAQKFYRKFQGSDWFPIDADEGSKDQPTDVDFWTYMKENEGDWSGRDQKIPSEDEIKGQCRELRGITGNL
jgi:hypothetical protein